MKLKENNRNFTLVELLVVLVIIVFLVSMLLPALGRARRWAQSIACLSNLKQLGLGLTQYAMDNREFLLPVMSGTDDNKGVSEPANKTWNIFIADYIGINTNEIVFSSLIRATPVPVRYKKGIMKCPASSMPLNKFHDVQYGMPLYNIGGKSLSSELQAVRTFGDSRLPGGTAWLLDSSIDAPGLSQVDTSSLNAEGTYSVNRYWKGMYISRNRHARSSNVVFLDGHAQNCKESFLRYELNKGAGTSVFFGYGGNK